MTVNSPGPVLQVAAHQENAPANSGGSPRRRLTGRALAFASVLALSGCDSTTLETNASFVGNTAVCIVTVWMNAFIPAGAGTVLAGPPPHAGKTAIGPYVGFVWYLTDQRWFSTVLGQPARMHSRVEFSVPFNGQPSVRNSYHTSDPTVELTNTAVTCTASAPTTGMLWGPVTARAPFGVMLTLDAAAANPCIPGAPNIDYQGDLVVVNRRAAAAGDVIVSFNGLVDAFPAFEMYATDGTTTVTIGRLANAGNGPSNLFGDAATPFGSTKGGLCSGHWQGSAG